MLELHWVRKSMSYLLKTWVAKTGVTTFYYSKPTGTWIRIYLTHSHTKHTETLKVNQYMNTLSHKERVQFVIVAGI